MMTKAANQVTAAELENLGGIMSGLESNFLKGLSKDTVTKALSSLKDKEFNPAQASGLVEKIDIAKAGKSMGKLFTNVPLSKIKSLDAAALGLSGDEKVTISTNLPQVRLQQKNDILPLSLLRLPLPCRQKIVGRKYGQ